MSPIVGPAQTAADAPPTQAPTADARRNSLIRPRLVLAPACVTRSMVGLNIAIVNVALPSIQRDLGVRQSSVQRVVVATDSSSGDSFWSVAG